MGKSAADHLRQNSVIYLIHGTFHEKGCFSEVQGELKTAGFNPIPWNLPGGERSDTWVARHLTSIRGCVKALDAEVDKYDQCPILLAHSLGCIVVELLLKKRRPPAVILLAPTRPTAFLWTTLYFAWTHPLRFLLSLFTLTTHRVVGTLELWRHWFFSPGTDPAVVGKSFADRVEESWLICVRLMTPFPIVWKGHPEIPILVIRGDQDKSVPKRVVESVAALHGTEAKVAHNVAHDMMLDTGWKGVTEMIVDWLGDQGLAPKGPL